MPPNVPPPEPPTGSPPVSERLVRRVLWILGSGLALAVGLIVFTPQLPPPPSSPAQPDQAFVDNARMVSPAYARSTAGAILNDPRAQIVVYTTPRAPDSDLRAWSVQAATDWKIGSAKEDMGIVLFVFRDARIAHAEVGYGLEGLLPDAKIRRLLETTLLPAFTRGDYEAGFDAWLRAVREELGGDAGLARAAVAAVTAPDVPFHRQILAAYPRLPRMLAAVWQRFREEGLGARLAIVVFAGVALGIAGLGVSFAVNTLWRLATLPRNWRNSPARSAPKLADGSIFKLAGDLKLFELAMGPAGFAICFILTGFVVLQAEDYFTRKGRFGGAGAGVTWPAALR